AIMKTTSELLVAVNASNAEDCVAVWAPDGVLMPPNHPSVHGHQAIGEYFRRLFLRRKFRFAFTSSHLHVAGDTALELVTYTVVIQSGPGAAPIDDVGKGLHVYARQANGSWKVTGDIWNSDRSGQVQ
ncbi:MAG TPA: nuclear transport factor 2 family protein, partial [Vicinamibacterales bacterium]